MKPDATIRIVGIFHTADPGILAVATSLLDDAGIDHSVKGGIQGNVFGWGTSGSPGVGIPEILVRDGDAAHARALLASLTSQQ